MKQKLPSEMKRATEHLPRRRAGVARPAQCLLASMFVLVEIVVLGIAALKAAFGLRILSTSVDWLYGPPNAVQLKNLALLSLSAVRVDKIDEALAVRDHLLAGDLDFAYLER